MHSSIASICMLSAISGFITYVSASPKYAANNVNNHADVSGWSQPYINENLTREHDLASTKDRLERLGYTTGYGSINSFPTGTGLAGYNPIKLDLGGVVLGTLVGIGAIIIIPKLLNIFHGNYASYGRSVNDNDYSALNKFISKIDDFLGQNSIDSTSCVQRAVCTYARSTESNMKLGSADHVDKIFKMLSENSLVDYMLDGTAVKDALEHGRDINEKPCDKLYNSCPVDDMKLTTLFKTLFSQKQEEEVNGF